jgi:hypothetical protein
MNKENHIGYLQLIAQLINYLAYKNNILSSKSWRQFITPKPRESLNHEHRILYFWKRSYILKDAYKGRNERKSTLLTLGFVNVEFT